MPPLSTVQTAANCFTGTLMLRAVQEYSRQVSYAEGQAFAKRMNSAFIEASAKTAVGVTEAFREVVVNIMNSPDLWSTPKSKTGIAGNSTSNSTMPGTINLDDAQEDAGSGGCSC